MNGRFTKGPWRDAGGGHDTGIGIPLRKSANCSIASPRPTPRRRGSMADGVGAGEISRRLVELMGGEIGGDSTPGQARPSGSIAPLAVAEAENDAVETRQGQAVDCDRMVGADGRRRGGESW